MSSSNSSFFSTSSPSPSRGVELEAAATNALGLYSSSVAAASAAASNAAASAAASAASAASAAASLTATTGQQTASATSAGQAATSAATAGTSATSALTSVSSASTSAAGAAASHANSSTAAAASSTSSAASAASSVASSAAATAAANSATAAAASAAIAPKVSTVYAAWPTGSFDLLTADTTFFEVFFPGNVASIIISGSARVQNTTVTTCDARFDVVVWDPSLVEQHRARAGITTVNNNFSSCGLGASFNVAPSNTTWRLRFLARKSAAVGPFNVNDYSVGVLFIMR